MAEPSVVISCPVCGREFTVCYDRGKFCSRGCYLRTRRFTPEYFWSKVRKTEGCWLWEGRKNHQGYGAIKVNSTAGSPAHRVAWELVNGPIPEGLQVLHDCPGGDNPSCVNPAHLFLGTQADNMADKASKGRQAKGSKHGMSKLTEQDVRDIRAAHAGGANYERLAERYGVMPHLISGIVRRLSWKHVV